jgi:hypothetical protein
MGIIVVRKYKFKSKIQAQIKNCLAITNNQKPTTNNQEIQQPIANSKQPIAII